MRLMRWKLLKRKLWADPGLQGQEYRHPFPIAITPDHDASFLLSNMTNSILNCLVAFTA
jgi:hypothetical protein